MISTDALIRDLSTDLVPVKRRSAPREAAMLAALAGAEIALLVWAGVVRPDMAQVITAPFMLWKMGSLALLAGVSCALALRSLAPPAAPRRGLLLIGLAALVIVGGMFVTPAADSGRSLLQRLAPVHGMICATAITVLSMPIMAAMAVLMRRAAPVRPRQAAFGCGLGAGTSSALIFTICCPMNDPFYIAVWYSVAVAAVALAARWLLPGRFRL